ncbi:hypothetical protein [Xanthomonas nasturtii]|uniref:hypothetical protein n=1 Tax=Xanthomonas nasturtii TaxID=1843581 RepID=UPI00128FD596|nr:hypothetical protein [Xanthomonas nasturtii]WVL56558.1 hypothetical protein M3O54_020015 [Xanthomonas nasturtii]
METDSRKSALAWPPPALLASREVPSAACRVDRYGAWVAAGERYWQFGRRRCGRAITSALVDDLSRAVARCRFSSNADGERAESLQALRFRLYGKPFLACTCVLAAARVCVWHRRHSDVGIFILSLSHLACLMPRTSVSPAAAPCAAYECLRPLSSNEWFCLALHVARHA